MAEPVRTTLDDSKSFSPGAKSQPVRYELGERASAPNDEWARRTFMTISW